MHQQNNIRIQCGAAWWRDAASKAQTRSITATPAFIETLSSQRISLIVASRQDSTATIISALDGQCTATRARIHGPMGVAACADTIAFGTAMGVRIYRDITNENPDAATYLPVAMHMTGAISIHDVGWDGNGKLWFVNTLFSALCVTDTESHFRLVWRPHFLEEKGPLDCCHLNGMTLDDDGPRFVTALSSTGTRESWRINAPDGGMLMDIRSGIWREGLSMPHSPKIHGESIWLLESGRGQLITISSDNNSMETVWRSDGILRGLDFSGDCAFVGQSKLRESSASVFAALSERLHNPSCCHIYAIDVQHGKALGHAALPDISEISSVTVIRKPQVFILEPDQLQTAATFVYRDEAGSA